MIVTTNSTASPAEIQIRALLPSDEMAFHHALAVAAIEMKRFDFALGYHHAKSFEDYLNCLDRWKHGRDLPPGQVPSDLLVAIKHGDIIGRLSLRHQLTDHLFREGGHLGYGVLPAWRNQGVASALLQAGLERGRRLGLSRILLTTALDNHASIRVIEKAGGLPDSPEECQRLNPLRRRFWINI